MYAGIWMFAWDLADEGIDEVLGFCAGSGLTAIHLASAYHAGWFVHPHNPHHKAYYPEDGVVYFQPQMRLYEKTVLRPKVASVSAHTDWFREAGQRLDHYGLKLVAWTVCTHNTRLGLAHPECTVRNAFGDSYPHALCPANDQVRLYLTSLCQDLTTSLPLYAVQLETPGYLDFHHGHHHERDLTVLSPLERRLMSLCFCPSCVSKAKAKGVQVEGLQAGVKAMLEAAFRYAPGRPKDYPQDALQLAQLLPELAQFEAFRKGVEDTLVCDIRGAFGPSPCRLFFLGDYNDAIADAVDAFNILLYGQRPPLVLTNTRTQARQLRPRNQLYVGIRLGLGSVSGPEELTAILKAIQEGGGHGVMFYNYSESPMETLSWIKPALAALS